MKISLLNIICCPLCKGGFDILEYDKHESEIKEGLLVCKKCKKSYSIKNYVPRFINDDGYVGSFSFQWLKHRRTQLDYFNKNHESEKHFIMKTGFNAKQLKNKIVLDVGCGVGRFMDIALKYGAEVVGIDLSYSIDVARENFMNNKNAHFIQADIFNLPFKENIFDYIYSIGVLHHTPDPRKAFSKLPKLLKKHGRISIWVYSNDGLYLKIYNLFSDFYRIFTTRMKKRSLYTLSNISIPLYYIKKIPLLGKVLQALIPTSLHSNKEWRVLETYDFYSPKYQHHYETSEIINWYKENNLKNLVVLDDKVCIQGEK